MTTILLAVLIVGAAIALIAVRVLFLKGGIFRKTCSSRLPFLKKEGIDCPTCGANPEESCKKDESKTSRKVIQQT